MNTREFSGQWVRSQCWMYESTEYGFPFPHQTVWGEPVADVKSFEGVLIPQPIADNIQSNASQIHYWGLTGNIVIWIVLGFAVFVVRRLVAVRLDSPP